MSLSLSSGEITKRSHYLRRTFGPIAPNGRVECFFRTTARGAINGLGKEPNIQDLRRMRHPSNVANIFINYFEIWQDNGQDAFLLDKAYFHLDARLTVRDSSEEILAIHCDALAKQGEVAFLYKRGPHLHISGNKRDFSKAHIALCLSDLEKTCSNVDAFSDAFSGIIKMVGDEILPQLART